MISMTGINLVCFSDISMIIVGTGAIGTTVTVGVFDKFLREPEKSI